MKQVVRSYFNNPEYEINDDLEKNPDWVISSVNVTRIERECHFLITVVVYDVITEEKSQALLG